uniref:Retrovirus-related Pol polyprotein from transposon TNT 1-94-like beta-barrel domain-containing protein n=1 Tax=Timema douglasi TaxID=61478 RepID=A0A7R8VVA6_TIMDO|nr:unnamed protein product [Timema douglasi]
MGRSRIGNWPIPFWFRNSASIFRRSSRSGQLCDCPAPKKRQENGQQNTHSDRSQHGHFSEFSSEQQASMQMLAVTTEDNWTMDSGASAHMTNRCDYLSKFEETVDNTSVVLGNIQGLASPTPFFNHKCECTTVRPINFLSNRHSSQFNQQNKDLRFGNFVFGPVVMRMFYYMNTPDAALENTKESFDLAMDIWRDLQTVGHIPLRRSATFAAALALNQNSPQYALEIISTVRQQNYITVRNIKMAALADLGRVDDALPILRSILLVDDPEHRKQSVTEDVVSYPYE